VPPLTSAQFSLTLRVRIDHRPEMLGRVATAIADAGGTIGDMPADALGRMAPGAIVFAMANPTPEATPEEAAPYARVIATGRSDYPNQINNVLCFPGILRGALDVRAREITEAMKMAAAEGIAAIVGDDELREDYVIPSAFNRDVAPAVADAVAREARRTGWAEASADGFGYAEGDTSEFRPVPS